MSKIINVGRVTAYAEAVAGGYTGTLEEWERDLANLGTTAAEVEANRQAVAEDKAAVQEDLTTVESYKNSAAQSASEALQSAENAHTDALASTAAKEAAQTAQGLAEEARTDAVSAKGAAESAQTAANASASAAAGSALAAGNAAQTAAAQAGAASDSATAAAASAASVSGVVQEVTAAKTEAITAIETKGAETLDSIPDDYTELSGDVDDLESAISNIQDIGTALDDFKNTPAYNATYYNGGVKEWGTTQYRVMNTTTRSYPFKVKIKAIPGYTVFAVLLDQPKTFTGNETATQVGGSGAYVQEYTAEPNVNLLLLVKKGGGSLGSPITPEEWGEALSIEQVIYDLTTLTEKVNALMPSFQKSTESGVVLNIKKQGFNISQLSYSPHESANGSLQGFAINNNVLFEGHADGSIELRDLSTGTVINTFQCDPTTHCGNISFWGDYYDANDEFPLIQIDKYKYRVTRDSFELIETLNIDTTVSGYQQNIVATEKNLLWVVGTVNNDYNAGGGFIITLYSTTNSTLNLLQKYILPFIKYIQFIRWFNGQLLAGFGSDVQTIEGKSKICIISETGITPVIADLPDNMANAEIEGCDFVLNENGNQYDMIWGQRQNTIYFKFEF